MNVRLSNEKTSELREAFMLFDYSKSGKISMKDIGPVIRSIGLKPSESEVHEMMQDVNEMGGEVDLSTLVQLITTKVTEPVLDRPDDLKDMFKLYDPQGRGSISVKEMKHLLTSVGDKLTEEEVDQLLRSTACVQNGAVNYDKFIQTIIKG